MNLNNWERKYNFKYCLERTHYCNPPDSILSTQSSHDNSISGSIYILASYIISKKKNNNSLLQKTTSVNEVHVYRYIRSYVLAMEQKQPTNFDAALK